MSDGYLPSPVILQLYDFVESILEEILKPAAPNASACVAELGYSDEEAYVQIVLDDRICRIFLKHWQQVFSEVGGTLLTRLSDDGRVYRVWGPAIEE